MHLFTCPSEPKEGALSSKNMHWMDRSDPVTLQLPQQLLVVKSNVVCMTSRPLSHFYTSSSAPIIPEHTAQSPLHCHLPLLASVYAVPSLWNSLPHFCTWCTIALNAAPRSPPPRSPPDSPPTHLLQMPSSTAALCGSSVFTSPRAPWGQGWVFFNDFSPSDWGRAIGRCSMFIKWTS